MSDSDAKGVAKGMRIERAQTARPFDGLDRRLGLVAQRVDTPSSQPSVRRVRIECQGAIESRRRHRRLAGQQKQRVGGPTNRFGVIALGFERLSGQAAGFGDVVSGQCSPPLHPLRPPAPADQSRGRRVGRIDRQRLPGKDDCLGKTLFGKAIGLLQGAQIEVVRGEVRGRLAADALDLGLAQFGSIAPATLEAT